MSEVQTVEATQNEILANNPPHRIRKWVTSKLNVGNSITHKETEEDGSEMNYTVKYLGTTHHQISGDKRFQITQVQQISVE